MMLMKGCLHVLIFVGLPLLHTVVNYTNLQHEDKYLPKRHGEAFQQTLGN